MVNFTFQLVEGYDSNDGVIGTINFTVDGVVNGNVKMTTVGN